jgi:heme/copper-type cytochrome/quinol oxidase subunit 2
MLIWLQVKVGGFFPPVAFILAPPALVVAVLIAATRRRWVSLLAVLYWTLLVAAHTWQIPYSITHPEYFDTFVFTVLVLALAVVGIVAAVGATVQNYRAPTAAEMGDERRRVPRWFVAVLWSVAGLCLGAILVGAIPRTTDTAGVSREALAALPALAVGKSGFEQTQLRARVGEIAALRLENRDNGGRSFDIDELTVHIPLPAGTSGLALFTPSTPGTYTFYCGIPGHRALGMVGTLIVEP